MRAALTVQAIVPAHIVPQVFQDVLKGASPLTDYLAQSNDPLLPNAWDTRYAWFRMAVLSEFFVQVPAFTLGIWAMWNSASTLTRRQARVSVADSVRYPRYAPH